MSILNTISGAASTIGIGGSALSLVGMGMGLIMPSQKRGIEGFLFDIDLTSSVDFAAQITDHYAEDNSAIQDHVAFSPMTISLTGKIGELVYKQQAAVTFLRAMADRLTAVGAISPSLGGKALAAISTYETAVSAYDSISKNLNSIADVFSGTPAMNAQQKALMTLKLLYDGRTLCSVETPWQTFQNMIIESFTAAQDETNVMETTFTVNFKEIRYIKTSTGTGTLIGRIKEQAQKTIKKGTQSGAKEKTGLATGVDAAVDYFKGTK